MPAAPTYNCVSGNCVDPGDGSGIYGTLAACLAACSSGSGSGNFTDASRKRVFGRQVDVIGGLRAFLIACGHDACGGEVNARFVDVIGGRRAFLAVDECRNPYPPNSPDITFVAKTWNPPFGISNRVLFQLFPPFQYDCWLDTACPWVILTWDGTSKWVGDLPTRAGSLHFEFVHVLPNFPGSTGPWGVYMSGCYNAGGGDPLPLPLFVNCKHPFRAGGAEVFALPVACCGSMFTTPSPESVPYALSGFVHPTYMARMIGIKNGLRLFMGGDCCPRPSDCPVTQTCCGCPVVPRRWTFTIGGVVNGVQPPVCTCSGFNGTWTLVYQGNCVWAVEDNPGICTPGPPWRLMCSNVGTSGGTWSLVTETPPGVAYEVAAANWNCLGPNVMPLVSAGTNCTGFPGTITITPE